MASKYRSALPQLQTGNDVFLTDGGLETVLLFEQGRDLPEFAAFPLLDTEEGRKTLMEYSEGYVKLAKTGGIKGFVLETPTWRAHPDCGQKLGFDKDKMEEINVLAGKKH